nr:TetR/AcrR family transcriptional regulator [Mucilaginibacter sp. L294]
MTTEEHILNEARDIFYRKGLAGTRMQEIADKAGINKAMLHYYFKTKELLFNRIFEQAFAVFAERVAEVLKSDVPLEQKIVDYVNHTVDALAETPGIPVFVLNELTFNPERITDLFAGKNKIDISYFKDQVDNQTHGKTDANNLFMDMVALCVYPFVIAPVFKRMLQQSDQQYKTLLQERKAHIINELLKRL